MTEQSKVELKYCERCGGLRLRRDDSKVVYCPSCAVEMNQLSLPRRRNPSPALRLPRNLGGVACA
jgi:Zn-finger nucleic acid-binding protein